MLISRERWRPAGEFQFSTSDWPAGRQRSRAIPKKLNVRGNCRRNNDARCRRCRTELRRRRQPRRRWKISWTTSSSRNADTRCFSNPSSGRGFRCRARTSRNEIRKSAWVEIIRWGETPSSLNFIRGKVKARQSLAPPDGITAIIFRGAANGRGSSAPRRRRWCLQKEIAASAIRRGRRKRPRWTGSDAAKTDA